METFDNSTQKLEEIIKNSDSESDTPQLAIEGSQH